jgi:hypothetical protein
MISLNPVLTSNAADTFSVTLDGMMQGMAMDDPAIRYQLTGGQLAPTETLPMFGGVPISEYIPPITNIMDSSLQNLIARATTAPTVTGISVFNQNHAMINTPQSPVPQADIGMLVNFYRNGSRARIPFALDPAFPFPPPTAPGMIVMPTALGFNVINQWVCAQANNGVGGFNLPATYNVIGYNIGNSMTVVYNATTGFAVWNRRGNTILLEI